MISLTDNGWIKLHRELADKAIWQESTPEQKTILITLLMMANHKEKEWEWKGQRYKAKPGQFVTSLPSIVKKCGKGITMQNVRTALARFEKYEFLTCQSTNRNRLVTIVNWDLYQAKDDEPNSQPNRQLTGNQQATNRQLTGNQQATNRQLTANKNDKNDKKINTPIVPKGTERFEIFWKSYPKKVGKGAAEKAWKKIKPSKDLLQTILTAIEQQKKSDQWQKDNGQYIPNPATWLNQKRWEDEPDKPQKTKYDNVYL